MIVHMLVVVDGREQGACGAALLEPQDTPEALWDWTEDRDEVTCEDCATRADERAFERDEERRLEQAGIAAHDRAVDRYIEDHR